MASNDDNDYTKSNEVKYSDSELGTLRKMLQQLNGMAGSASLGASVSLAKDSTSQSILTRLNEIRAGDGTEPVTEQDDGPAELASTTNLKAVSLGSAQTLVSAPGASLRAQIRDMFVSVDTDVRVSIFSGASTLLVSNLKASNGTIQLCPRQGFTGEVNTAIEMIATTATGTQDTTVNSVSVS
jgi:hypothetical protein